MPNDESRASVLKASHDALWDTYDVAMLDLDGVVYVGPDAVPGAPEHLDAGVSGRNAPRLRHQQRLAHPKLRRRAPARARGRASRTGTSSPPAQAAARVLRNQLDKGAAVFVIGGEGSRCALRERGLRPVQDRAESPVAVVSGLLRRPALGDGHRRRHPGA